MRIGFLAGGDDGSSWYRCALPAESLQWQGHDVLVAEAMSPRQIASLDVIIGSRVSNPGAVAMWERIREVRTEGSPRLILDLDDAYFAVPEANPASAQWDADQLGRLARAIAASDVVTVASERLADHVWRTPWLPAMDRSKIVVVENGLHAGWLSTPRNYSPEVLNIGWSGTADTSRHFDMITKPLARALNTSPVPVEGRLVGLPFSHPSLGYLAKHLKDPELLQAAEWVHHGQPYLQAVASFDIWLAPYRSDPFVDAKFPTKALEAGMLGIPLIASAIPPYQEWITDGVDGFLVPTYLDHLWGKRLLALIKDPALRQSMGEAARSRAARNIMQTLGLQWEAVALG